MVWRQGDKVMVWRARIKVRVGRQKKEPNNQENMK
jgi:hypothetical protein